MEKEELLKMAKERNEKYDIGDVLEGNGFIVYSIQDRSWNKYGRLNSSGITIWEGIYALNGKKQISIVPMAMWRNGESAANDKPWCRWIIKELDGEILTIRNWDNGEIKKMKIDFGGGD